MDTTDTQRLLGNYVQRGDESAFGELVARYLGLVYSTALRHLDDAHLAEDAAQIVFTDFARKSRTLPEDVMLGGWLYRHTCFVATNVRRADQRRLSRETLAAQMNISDDNSDETWKQVAPVLDQAINELSDEDRDAVVLRFFEKRDFRAIGARFGISDDAAQKRVSRVVEKLRELLVRHGVTLSVATISGFLTNQATAFTPGMAGAQISEIALSNAKKIKPLFSSKLFLPIAALVVIGFVVPTVLNNRPNKPIAADTIISTRLVARPAPVDQTNNGPVVMANGSTGITNVVVAKKTDVFGNATNFLHLTIVAADSGRPIPNVPLELRCWRKGTFNGKTFSSDRVGICAVPLLDGLTQFELTTRKASFADTRLAWRPDRGDVIPTNYTLKLDRAVLIGGKVVGPDGEAVEGAKVGFNQEDDLTALKGPESHEFSWIETKTDSEGRWQMNRIAADMIRRLRGGARHTNYVDSEYLHLEEKPDVQKELLAQTHVFKLGKGATIHGFVIDSDNQPIEKAKVFFGGRSMSHRREGVSGPDGSFVLNGCRMEEDTLSADAKGFAVTTIKVEPKVKTGPYELKLQHGKTLRMLVQNKKGEPIPRANVWLDIFGNSLRGDEKAPVPVQANFSPTTDKQGRVLWTNAPDMELAFDVQAAGYLRKDGIKMRPDDQEHLVVLDKSLVVSGKVIDESGRPIPRFRVILGYPQKEFPGDKTHPVWSTIDRFWLTFSGGTYKHLFDEAVIGGAENPGYVLKFEAEGYAPFISRTLAPDEGEVTLDVILRAAALSAITVILPNGQPAVAADVGLVSAGARLNLVPGGFSRRNLQSAGTLLKTDGTGQFNLPPDDSIESVMVAHPEGFAKAERSGLESQPTIQLQPWGRVEGVYLTGGKAAVGRELKLEFKNESRDTVSLDYDAFKSEVNAEGKFSFPKVPAGEYKLIHMVPTTVAPGGKGWLHKTIKENIEVQPGETTELKFGDGGYTVRASLAWPNDLPRDSSMRVSGVIMSPNVASALEQMRTAEGIRQMSPELKELIKTAKHFSLEENQDGTLSTDEVSAGDYTLQIRVIQFTEKKMTEVARGSAQLSVPSEPATGTIELGKIQLMPVTQ